jgi:phosphate starvation-inducible protein PhoH and related proteins
MTLIHNFEDFENVVPLKNRNRQRRKEKRQEKQSMDKNHLFLESIGPKTPAQQRTFSYFDKNFNLMLHGYAGTGKTFISLFLALAAVEDNLASSITIIRSVVPSRDMGFLPGNDKDKAKVYEAPYIDICNKLFKRSDAYEILKQKKLITFMTTSFIRGTTLDNTIIIVDECQNMNAQELHTIITRVGDKSRIVFAGDFRQNDLNYKLSDQSGITQFMTILKKMKSFRTVEFLEDDIVRSGLVREYIIERAKLGFDDT